jgi:hypothetical protein
MILLSLAPSMLEEPVLRELLRVCKNIQGRRTDIMDLFVEFLDLVVVQGVAILLRVNLGMI